MKKVYILPNMVTTANIVCGFLSMVSSFRGEFTQASWFIIIAAFCDLMDGRIARFARATSSFGVQYDSLSDLTSFGIAPAILLYAFGLKDVPNLGLTVSAIYVVCAALRLARFNVSAEESNPSKIKKIRKGYFQGLPSPPSAALVVATVLMQSQFLILSEKALQYFLAFLGFLLGSLMVSNIPFPSFKEVNWRAKGKAWILFIPVLVILFSIQAPELTLFSIGYTYLISALGWATYLCLFRDKNSGEMSVS